MKRTARALFLSSVIALSFTACSKTDEPSTATTNQTPVNTVSDVAGDKSKIISTLQEAHARGTLQTALNEAAQDSTLRDAMRNALVNAGGLARTAEAASAKKTTGKTPARTVSNNTKKDVLDQTNDALDKTNRTIDRTTETINKANEIGRKADQILNGRK
jgi:hypothetical protein